MTTPDLAAPRPPPADPALRDALMQLAALGVRIALVAAGVAAVEGRIVAVLAASLPESLGAVQVVAAPVIVLLGGLNGAA